MPLKKYLQKNVYRWHRLTSLIVAVPVLFWTLSGFLHPVMNAFKPDVKSQLPLPVAIDTAQIKVPMQQALQQNKIESLHNFRIVLLKGTYYYQIEQLNKDTLTYIDCATGNTLPNGDIEYAIDLTKKFLGEAQTAININELKTYAAQMQAGSKVTTTSFSKVVAINSSISDVQLLTGFTKDYKESNKILPVYRVAFNRNDKIRLYIETKTDRLANAVDNRKAWFTNFFSMAHTWSFLDGWGNTKNVLLGCVAGLCFLTSLFGFYVYNISKKKKQKATSAAQFARIAHRTLGNVFLATTLLFSFSGAWHAFHKTEEQPATNNFIDKATFRPTELQFSFKTLLKNLSKEEKLTGLSVVKMNGISYWQLNVIKGKSTFKKYINSQSNHTLPDGDAKYGCYLACRFSNKQPHSVLHTQCLTSFTHGYSMMNKRLPVQEIDFADGDHYFIETQTGYLSAINNKAEAKEGFSFSNLHMHHYWEAWLGKETGKTVRTIVLITASFGLLLLSITGLFIYFRKQFLKINKQ